MTPSELKNYYLDLSHTVLDDGSIVIHSGVNLSDYLKENDPMNSLKSLECGLVISKIEGHFVCDDVGLKDLTGCPLEIRGNLIITNNKLTTLKGIGKFSNLYCENNMLTDLKYLQDVVGIISAENNYISTLKGSPLKVDSLMLSFNTLVTLEGCPQTITGDIHLNSCQNLISLEGSPFTIGGHEYEIVNCPNLKTLIPISKNSHFTLTSDLTDEQLYQGFLNAWRIELQKRPERIVEMPTEFFKELVPKLSDVANKVGVFEHLKTFEEYNLNDSYLNNSNEIKELLSNYNIKYQIFDENPVLKIVFPYSSSMYGGRWIDTEYMLIEAFLKELLRYNFIYKTNETDSNTIVYVDCL